MRSPWRLLSVSCAALLLLSQVGAAWTLDCGLCEHHRAEISSACGHCQPVEPPSCCADHERSSKRAVPDDALACACAAHVDGSATQAPGIQAIVIAQAVPTPAPTMHADVEQRPASAPSLHYPTGPPLYMRTCCLLL